MKIGPITTHFRARLDCRFLGGQTKRLDESQIAPDNI